jgi:hypothetical protein
VHNHKFRRRLGREPWPNACLPDVTREDTSCNNSWGTLSICMAYPGCVSSRGLSSCHKCGTSSRTMSTSMGTHCCGCACGTNAKRCVKSYVLTLKLDLSLKRLRQLMLLHSKTLGSLVAWLAFFGSGVKETNWLSHVA